MQSGSGARPFISLRDVAIRLNERVLFEHTCWELASDQHWAVLGPNGSGKSTLMKALCGRLPVVQGEIVYHYAADGAVPQQAIATVAFDAQRGIVARQDPFHQARFHSERSREGGTLAAFLSQSESRSQGGQRQNDVLRELGLDTLLERSMIQLSNGERRKAFIARALLRSPSLLILDNPFTGLDQRSRAGLRAAIEGLMQGDVRVILVGTEREELPEGITHVLRVADGRVVAQSPVGADEPRAAAKMAAVQPGNAAAKMAAVQPGNDAARMAAVQPGSAAARMAAVQPVGQVLVQMEGVRVAYNGTTVLDGVDWTVREGEHWALVGPNGAGKTTLLSLLLGDHPQAYANAVTLFGRRRGTGETIWEIKQQVGWVAPELHLYTPPGSSCLDVVCSGFHDSVGLYQRATAAERAQAVACMERLSIGGYASAAVPFVRLSEGEQRMVLVARALIKRPRLLVLDEPCQGLDAANEARVLEAIDALGAPEARGPSVIYVTHDGVFPRIVTHVLRLEAGRVVEREDLEGPGGP